MFDMDQFALTKRTALVIGGTGGIGREIVLGYRAAGATVLVSGRDEEKLKLVSAALGETDRTLAYRADARSLDSLQRLAEAVEADHGPVAWLVNCQGTTAIKPALELSEAEYDVILDTNLKSVFFACTTFGRRMVDRGGGSIINITSLAAHSGWAGAADYGASKMGVAGITQSFAAEIFLASDAARFVSGATLKVDGGYLASGI